MSANSTNHRPGRQMALNRPAKSSNSTRQYAGRCRAAGTSSPTTVPTAPRGGPGSRASGAGLIKRTRSPAKNGTPSSCTDRGYHQSPKFHARNSAGFAHQMIGRLEPFRPELGTGNVDVRPELRRGAVAGRLLNGAARADVGAVAAVEAGRAHGQLCRRERCDDLGHIDFTGAIPTPAIVAPVEDPPYPSGHGTLAYEVQLKGHSEILNFLGVLVCGIYDNAIARHAPCMMSGNDSESPAFNVDVGPIACGELPSVLKAEPVAAFPHALRARCSCETVAISQREGFGANPAFVVGELPQVLDESHHGLSFFAFFQRAWTAFRAAALRSSGVRFAFRARAPRFPRATACGFFRFDAMRADLSIPSGEKKTLDRILSAEYSSRNETSRPGVEAPNRP